MNKDKKQEITWFEPFSEKENESSGFISRLLKRPQRSRVQIDEQNQSVKFEKSAVESRPTNRVSASEMESTGGETTENIVYSPPRTLSTVIDRLDTLGRSKVLHIYHLLSMCLNNCVAELAYAIGIHW